MMYSQPDVTEMEVGYLILLITIVLPHMRVNLYIVTCFINDLPLTK